MAALTAETAPDDEPLTSLVALREESGPALRAACAAFDELYARHARPLVAFLAARVRRGDLDDLNQEVWRRAWHHLPEQFRGGNFRAWLHRIARNALIDHARKRRPGSLEDEDRLADDRSGQIDARLLERERAEALRDCLSRLGGETAELVRARLGGDPYPDICRRLGLTPARAHKLFHLAKEQLQTCLERALA
jgi:RNA polymerase sigma-70 factor (ECF subfamily)